MVASEEILTEFGELKLELFNLKNYFKELNNKIREDNYYVFVVEEGLLNIKESEIYYIECKNRKIYLYTKENEYELKNTSFKELFNKLYGFIQINRGCMVNRKYIRIIQDDEIVLENKSVLYISRRRLNEVKNKMFII